MISCDELTRRTVIDASGQAIGEVEVVILNPTSWRVQALRVRLRDETIQQIGATKKLFRKAFLDISPAAVQSVGDAVLLCVKAEELREAPPGEEPLAHAPR